MFTTKFFQSVMLYFQNLGSDSLCDNNILIILCNLDAKWTSYPGLPDVCCPPPPRRWMSALAAPCPRPARPQLS